MVRGKDGGRKGSRKFWLPCLLSELNQKIRKEAIAGAESQAVMVGGGGKEEPVAHIGGTEEARPGKKDNLKGGAEAVGKRQRVKNNVKRS